MMEEHLQELFAIGMWKVCGPANYMPWHVASPAIKGQVRVAAGDLLREIGIAEPTKHTATTFRQWMSEWRPDDPA
jgi:hypothetical protein